ncbi:fluoride efflux transporter CrcB [Yinghuangia sp. ASG 101]|nr:fluoride efflux transporter CrcB [Yinghuangia sp. ASG 101]UGQ15454.1 fluoride efflux transporter CrcB [Yinghuangia sp. ASG 101]
MVDPDVDFRPDPTPSLWNWSVLGVIAIGGALGASARYGAGLLWPTPAGAFPWTTFGVNALGCTVMGAFMVLATEMRTAHHLVRPFVGTGILGGFTTFSTYAVDIRRLVEHERAGLAAAYLAATVLTALVCVWAATGLTRWAACAAGARECVRIPRAETPETEAPDREAPHTDRTEGPSA